MAESRDPMAASDRGHRLDRIELLFRLARQPSEGAGARRGLGRAVVGPWRRLLSQPEISGRAEPDARPAALVQMGGLFHLDQRLFAARADLLFRRAELSDRSGQGASESGGGDRHWPGGAGARLARL